MIEQVISHLFFHISNSLLLRLTQNYTNSIIWQDTVNVQDKTTDADQNTHSKL
jgi:hypothetical protein